jgi:hypothetical protein
MLVGLVLALVCSAAAQQIVSPSRGAPLRSQVLDALRPTAAKETGGPVIFVVKVLNVMGDWAYVEAEPKRPGGEAVDWRKTRFREAYAADAFSGLVLALLRNKGGRWTVSEHIVGPTDVAWIEWQRQYKLPEALFRER